MTDVRYHTIKNLLAQPHIGLADATTLRLPMKTTLGTNKCECHHGHSSNVWKLCGVDISEILQHLQSQSLQDRIQQFLTLDQALDSS